jgi:hypothetical protein
VASVKKQLVILVILLLTITSTVNAQDTEWKDKQYNFNTVKTILLLEPSVGEKVEDPFAKQKITEYIEKRLPKNIKFIKLNDAIQDAINNKILTEDDTKDGKVFLSLFLPYAAGRYDAMLTIRLHAMYYSDKFQQGFSYNYTTYNATHVTGSNGYVATIQTPQQNNVNVPGGYRSFANTAMEFVLTDMKTNKMIWGYTASESDMEAVLFGATTDGLAQSIIKKAFRKMPVDKE